MGRLFLVVSLVLAALAQPAAAQIAKGDPIGIVLLHGKWGDPGKLSKIAADLRAAGLIVDTREMPWSGRRRYDRSYEGAMSEIDAAVARLKAKGARRIIEGAGACGGRQ